MAKAVHAVASLRTVEALRQSHRAVLQHVWRFLAISAIPAAAHLAWNVLQDALIHATHPDWPVYGVTINSSWGLTTYLSTFYLSCIGWLVCLCACGLPIAFMTSALFGVTASPGVRRDLRPRWARSASIQIITVLSAWGFFIAMLACSWLFAARFLSSDFPAVPVLLVWYLLETVTFFVAAPLGLWLYVRRALAVSASVLQNIPPRRAIERSKVLAFRSRSSILSVLLFYGTLRLFLGTATQLVLLNISSSWRFQVASHLCSSFCLDLLVGAWLCGGLAWIGAQCVARSAHASSSR